MILCCESCELTNAIYPVVTLHKMMVMIISDDVPHVGPVYDITFLLCLVRPRIHLLETMDGRYISWMMRRHQHTLEQRSAQYVQAETDRQLLICVQKCPYTPHK